MRWLKNWIKNKQNKQKAIVSPPVIDAAPPEIVECFRCGKTEEKNNARKCHSFWLCKTCFRPFPITQKPKNGYVRISRDDQEYWEKYLHILFVINHTHDVKEYVALDCTDGLAYFVVEENVQYGGASGTRLEPVEIQYDEISRFAKLVPGLEENYETFDYLHWYRYIPENKWIREEGMFPIGWQLHYYFRKEKGTYLSDVLNKWEHVTHINPRDECCYYYEPAFCAADRAGYRRLDSLENILRREKN